MNAAVLLLCLLLSAPAIETRGRDVGSSGNQSDGQADDERSWHKNLAPCTGAATPAELGEDVAKGPAGRSASKMVGLGLVCCPLQSRANLTSSATPIGDHIAATAATTTGASAAARSRDRLSHDVSLCRSMAEAELSKPTGPKWNAPQHYWKRHAEPFASNTAQFQVVDERSAHGHSSTAVVMTNMNDEPCANAVDWGSNTVKARSTQVRPQSLHGSMWHSEVIQSLAQRSLRYPDSTMSFDLRSSLPGSNMDPRAEPLPFGQAWVGRPPLCPPAFAVGIANVLSHSRPTHSRPLSTSAMML